jgi:hypothetical protein
MKLLPQNRLLEVALLLFTTGTSLMAGTIDKAAPFSVTISTSQEAVRSGSEIRLTATLLNTSGHNIVVDECTCDQNWGYSTEVRNAQGQWIPAIGCQVCAGECSDPDKPDPTATGVCASGPPTCICTYEDSVRRVLKPQETLTEVSLLSAKYNLSAPGKYTIRVKRRNDPRTIFAAQGKFGDSYRTDMHNPIDDASWATVKSNTIALTIVP